MGYQFLCLLLNFFHGLRDWRMSLRAFLCTKHFARIITVQVSEIAVANAVSFRKHALTQEIFPRLSAISHGVCLEA